MRISKEEQLVKEIENYIDQKDTQSIYNNLPKLLKGYNKLLKRTEKILKQSDSQQLEVLKLTEKLETSNNKINNLLNNAGEGFLYFDSEMCVGSEYSKEVSNIFEQDVAGKSITELLYPIDKDKEEFVRFTLQGILSEDDFKQEILISLLETEFVINNKFIVVQYKILDSSTFMMILTDVTSQRELDQKVHEKQQILKMVVEIVITKEQFLEVRKDYLAFMEKVDEFKSLELLSEFRKEVHTYKGLFAQKEMLHVVNHLHDFESLIDKSLKQHKLDSDIINITPQTMVEWLEDDLKIIKEILGEDYFDKQEYIEISKWRLRTLYAQVEEYVETKNTQLLDSIVEDTKNLQYKNIKLFFRPYQKLVEQLALTLEKNINQLEEDIDNIYVPDDFIPFLNTLVHIFRNSADHGIESPEKRFEANKSEFATIKCNIKKINQNLIIKISDDGAGIDKQKIGELLIEKGIYNQEQVASMSENDIIMNIFNDDFSTNKEVTKISGRGVGLASVKKELESLNGKITINNSLGSGVEFVFEVPFMEKRL